MKPKLSRAETLEYVNTKAYGKMVLGSLQYTIFILFENTTSGPEKHLMHKANKASSIFAMIRRTIKSLDTEASKPLYISLVRSHLEYVYAIWSPNKVKHTQVLENVQRRATKQISGLSTQTYEERL